MTTITVEIDEDKDLSAIKEFIARLGLKYHIGDKAGLLYTDKAKNILDERYASYQEGNINLLTAEESREKIHQLLVPKSK